MEANKEYTTGELYHLYLKERQTEKYAQFNYGAIPYNDFKLMSTEEQLKYAGMEAKTKETNVQLISRNGTLFAIIDGKEVQCKDQELAKKLIAPFKPDLNGEWSYSVPGYTVRVEEMCESDCCTMNGNCEHCQSPISLAVLSLEAPEKEVETPNWCSHHWNNDCTCAVKCCDHMLPKTTELPVPNKQGEQPAQPVDKYELAKRFADSFSSSNLNIEWQAAFRGFIAGLESVSPSPERGESDGFTREQHIEAIRLAFRAGENRGYESGNDYRDSDSKFPIGEDEYIKSIGL